MALNTEQLALVAANLVHLVKWKDNLNKEQAVDALIQVMKELQVRTKELEDIAKKGPPAQ